MKKCQICQSGKIKKLQDTIFCENCEIYFTLKDGKQRIKALPMVETTQRVMKLCSSCNKKATKNTTIKCKVFKQYLSRLPFCRLCKSLNSLFIKNLFYKNFLLYKKTRKTFGVFSCLFLLGLSYFFRKSLIFYYFYMVLLSENLSVAKVCVFTFFWYHINRYSFLHPIAFVMCLRKVLFSKEIYFDVPIDLLSVGQIENHLDRLNINTSSDRDAPRQVNTDTRKAGSCFELRNKKMF